MKRILITGGTGFVGTAFHQHFSDLGVETVRFDLHPTNDGSEYVKGDVRDEAALESAMSGVDGVLHLAAAHHDFGISKDTFHSVNVGGMESVCRVMSKLGLTRLCFYSTVAVYGSTPYPCEGTQPVPESEYGKTKLAAENVCRNWCDENEVNQCLTIRPTVIFGPNHFANMFTLVRQIESGKFFKVGKMDNIKSLAFVNNIVKTTIGLWQDNSPDRTGFECFNYVDQPDLNSWQIAEAVYAGLGKKPPAFVMPFGLAKLLAIPFDTIIALTGKNLPVSSQRIHKLAKAETRFNATKIHEASSVKCVSVPEGIEAMVRWYLEKGSEMSQLNRRPPASVE